MGQDKRRIPAGDETLLDRALDRLTAVCDRVDLLLDSDSEPPALREGLKIVRDREAYRGPLAALVTADREIAAQNLLLAVDMPNVTTTHLQVLRTLAEGGRAVVPTLDGAAQPLCALYPRAVLSTLTACYEAGELSLQRALHSLGDRVCPVGPDALGIAADAWDTVFCNLNSPEDLARWRATPPAG